VVDRAIAALNLSYVLHEPSTSNQVAAFVELLERDQDRIARSLRRLETLDDGALKSRSIARIVRPGPDAGRARHHVLTLTLGAWRLTKRLCGIWLADDGGVADPLVTYLDDPAESAATTVPLFRAPARLTPIPLDAARDAEAWWIAAAVFRPGFETLLLDLTRIGVVAPGGSRSEVYAAALPHAERLLRSYPSQWECRRALWPRPAEAALQEFRTSP
jgi:hypothetical protein